MKNIKKMAIMTALTLSLTTLSVGVFAKSNSTVAETVAKVTNKSVETVASERENGKAYGKIAADAGKLEEFKLERSKVRKDRLAEKVEVGQITQAEADAFIAKMQERQAECDGSGQNQNANGLGHGEGLGQGGQGQKSEGGHHRSGDRLQDGTGQKANQ